MPLSVSFDDASRLLARQVYGVVDDDTRAMAEDALELALQEVANSTHLIDQEGEGTLPLTGANSYNLSDVDTQILRVVKAWTSWGALEVMRKAEFVTRFPDYASNAGGIPRTLVLWGQDSLYVWPDQSDLTLNMIFYKILETAHASNVLFALLDIGRKFADPDKATRAINLTASQIQLAALNKGQTRASDSPIRFLPEQRIETVNRYKRERGR